MPPLKVGKSLAPPSLITRAPPPSVLLLRLRMRLQPPWMLSPCPPWMPSLRPLRRLRPRTFDPPRSFGAPARHACRTPGGARPHRPPAASLQCPPEVPSGCPSRSASGTCDRSCANSSPAYRRCTTTSAGASASPKEAATLAKEAATLAHSPAAPHTARKLRSRRSRVGTAWTERAAARPAWTEREPWTERAAARPAW